MCRTRRCCPHAAQKPLLLHAMVPAKAEHVPKQHTSALLQQQQSALDAQATPARKIMLEQVCRCRAAPPHHPAHRSASAWCSCTGSSASGSSCARTQQTTGPGTATTSRSRRADRKNAPLRFFLPGPAPQRPQPRHSPQRSRPSCCCVLRFGSSRSSRPPLARVRAGVARHAPSPESQRSVRPPAADRRRRHWLHSPSLGRQLPRARAHPGAVQPADRHRHAVCHRLPTRRAPRVNGCRAPPRRPCSDDDFHRPSPQIAATVALFILFSFPGSRC